MRWIISRLSLSCVVLVVLLFATHVTHALVPRLPKALAGPLNTETLNIARGAQQADAARGKIRKQQPRPIARQVPPQNVPDPRKPALDESADEETRTRETVFNGVHVPHIIDLSGKTFKEDIAKGYW